MTFDINPSPGLFFYPFSANQVSVFAETLSFLLEFSVSLKFEKILLNSLKYHLDTKLLYTVYENLHSIGATSNLGNTLEKHIYFEVKIYKF